jgi:hypothetical protein
VGISAQVCSALHGANSGFNIMIPGDASAELAPVTMPKRRHVPVAVPKWRIVPALSILRSIMPFTWVGPPRLDQQGEAAATAAAMLARVSFRQHAATPLRPAGCFKLGWALSCAAGVAFYRDAREILSKNATSPQVGGTGSG